MSTVLLSGLGNLGGWALEFLARSPGVDRIVTLKRSPWSGVANTTLAMIGSVFQGHTKDFSHHQLDLEDVDRVARLIGETRPSAILHSAAVASPRRLMRANLDPGLRETLHAATFGMWLPWHLLPASRLMDAVMRSGVDTHVVNASFPDVVNVALWKANGVGPIAGAGNVEICAAHVLRYVMAVSGVDPDTIDVSLVGSHALLAHGPEEGVPYHLRIRVGGRDVTGEYDLESVITRWPDPINWRRIDVFSLYAASAVKNLLALIGDDVVQTHVTSPNGLPGGYPAHIEGGHVDLDLPPGLSREEAVGINDIAARWDAVDHITEDGTVVYTADAQGAMSELGYRVDSVSIDDVGRRSNQLENLVNDLMHKENVDA